MNSPVYALVYKKSVAKELRRLPGEHRELIFQKILALAKNPYSSGSTKLQGHSSTYRIRQGDYRIIYQVDNGKLVILVVKIGHRKEVYRAV